MASDRKPQAANSIPIRFVDDPEAETEENEMDDFDQNSAADVDEMAFDSAGETKFEEGGSAELLAATAEVKRLQTALAESQEAVARRQADFENYRKRVERERTETYNRLVSDLVRKILPVVDNLGRALDAERSIEASESKEFRHFLNGVELIAKQLNEVLETFGVEPIAAVGEHFDPHIHEAVVTEPSDEYEPDTVIEELARGYRIGDRLLRPAMVKVSSQKSD
ncbi:MAG TPA: nucleotide exchange factor GrpE [Pyrinomonadaceae bacterium]|nr:nucleotide exchange factor GrpE [Pyrinomonadaceae bacterium]